MKDQPSVRDLLNRAIGASRDAAAHGEIWLPWSDLIETAARSGNVDLVLGLIDHLQPSTDWLTATALVFALTRAGQVSKIKPILAKKKYKLKDFAPAIASVLAEKQLENDFSAFVESVRPQPTAYELETWRIAGDLAAGRADKALQSFATVYSGKRRDMAIKVVQILYSGGLAEQARPLMPQLKADSPLFHDMVLETRDPGHALAYADAHDARQKIGEGAPVSLTAIALASGGHWRRAIETLDLHKGPRTTSNYVNVAIYARDAAALAVVEERLSDTGITKEDGIENMLAWAHVVCGNEAEALAMIDRANGGHDRNMMKTFVAGAFAEIGNPHIGSDLAFGIEDIRQRAWALSGIAAKFNATG